MNRNSLKLCEVLLFAATFAAAVAAQNWAPPTTMKKLANGLTVVVSEDHSAPTVGMCVSYGIGFRLEPEGRTGFAHLFEHMMFEGTPNAPKGVLSRVIEGGGGNVNGDTRYDYTEYIETAPLSALDPLLWIEADRMKTLDFSTKNLENQRNVVEEQEGPEHAGDEGRRRVGHVSIEEGDHVAARRRQGGCHGLTLPPSDLDALHDPGARVDGLRRRVVVRAVVEHDDLVHQAVPTGRGQEGLHHGPDH